jgi:hypothetical protein
MAALPRRGGRQGRRLSNGVLRVARHTA